ncbi:hypothetical protein CU665_14075 [Pseudomonas syringae pv. actinidifoliorum]|nr:hypothetical protein [Pseudomonas syringae pv. actinidifoliorum]NAT60045.1 hypothetical protein [Pseudomonas syringae pv. actinidifoliorum]
MLPDRLAHQLSLPRPALIIRLLILAAGRGSELVRERVDIIAENAPTETPSSRTSKASPGSLPRPPGRCRESHYSRCSMTYA